MISGALEVFVSEKPVATLHAGSMVGELGLYESRDRSADCKGSDDGVIAALKYEDVERLNLENPAVGMKFATFIAGNAVEKLRTRVTQLTNAVNARPVTAEATNVVEVKQDTTTQQAPVAKENTKKGWHHVKKMVSKRRVKKRNWLKASTEVFYRNKVKQTKLQNEQTELKLTQAEMQIQKSKERERREHILRKGLENTVDAMEEHIKLLEAQIKEQND